MGEVRVDRVMAELQDEVRERIRARLVSGGGNQAYADRALFDEVERLLRDAAEPKQPRSLLLGEILTDDDDWRLAPALNLSSHRPRAGGVILFAKRRVLLPIVRWLYDYAALNFRRQQRINGVLFACVEALALENARLRREIDALKSGR
jgi:hypothetical protein